MHGDELTLNGLKLRKRGIILGLIEGENLFRDFSAILLGNLDPFSDPIYFISKNVRQHAGAVGHGAFDRATSTARELGHRVRLRTSPTAALSSRTKLCLEEPIDAVAGRPDLTLGCRRKIGELEGEPDRFLDGTTARCFGQIAAAQGRSATSNGVGPCAGVDCFGGGDETEC